MGRTVCGRWKPPTTWKVLARAIDLGDSLDLLDDCDVVVGFTAPDVVMRTIEYCIPRGVHIVVGTSGFDSEASAKVAELLDGTDTSRPGGSQFQHRAVLMMRFAAVAAPFFESVEIVEMHPTGQRSTRPPGLRCGPRN